MRDSSQRLLTLLRGGQVDKPPFWEPWFAMGQMLQRDFGGSYLTMANELGHAAIPIASVNTNVTLIRPHERTSAGAYYAGGLLRERAQLEQMTEPDYPSQLAPILAQRRACAEAGIACWMILGWCFDRISASMGLEQLAMDCYDRPEFVQEAMAWVEARNRRALEAVIRHVRPDFLLYNADCAYKSGLMIAPQMLRQFCFEPTRKTVELIRELDIPLAFHSDGKLDDVMPFLLEWGITAVHGCEKQANDLGDLVARFGDHIALCGNMDVVFLNTASVEQVRQETLAMLEIGAAKGRFIAGCNTSPQDYLPVENYRAFTQTVASWPGRVRQAHGSGVR